MGLSQKTICSQEKLQILIKKLYKNDFLKQKHKCLPRAVIIFEFLQETYALAFPVSCYQDLG